jgi:hypothetical protein
MSDRKPQVIYGNVKNTKLIENLPEGVVLRCNDRGPTTAFAPATW